MNKISNYEINSKDYSYTISKAPPNSFGYTHQLNFSSESVHKGIITLRLRSQIPQWVEDTNDTDGSSPKQGKTYGIIYQILGIYEAFTVKGNYYTEIKININ